MVLENVANTILEIRAAYSALRDRGESPLEALTAIRRAVGSLFPNMYEIDLTPTGALVVNHISTEIIENNNMTQIIRQDEIDVRQYNESQLRDLAMDKTIQYFHEIDNAITSSRHNIQGGDYVSLVNTLLMAQTNSYETLRKVRNDQINRRANQIIGEIAFPARPVRDLEPEVIADTPFIGAVNPGITGDFDGDPVRQEVRTQALTAAFNLGTINRPPHWTE